jgi:hypothetical protein
MMRMRDRIGIFDIMEREKQSGLFRGTDYITILIILVFLTLALGVFQYYNSRIQTIERRIRQTGCLFDSRLKA